MLTIFTIFKNILHLHACHVVIGNTCRPLNEIINILLVAHLTLILTLVLLGLPLRTHHQYLIVTSLMTAINLF